MPAARTARGRLRQVERWIAANHKAPLPVRVHFLPRCGRGGEDFGQTRRIGRIRHVSHTRLVGGTLWISLSCSLLVWPDVAVRFLFHEYAHALCWAVHLEGDVREQDHPDEWGLWVARLEREFYDEGGWLDACEFSPRPWR